MAEAGASTTEANNGLSMIVVGWTLVFVTTIVVSLRLYARATLVRRIALDDFLMVTSVVSCTRRSVQNPEHS